MCVCAFFLLFCFVFFDSFYDGELYTSVVKTVTIWEEMLFYKY